MIMKTMDTRAGNTPITTTKATASGGGVVYSQAAHHIGMTGKVFRRRMHDDVGAKIQGPLAIRRGEGVVTADGCLSDNADVTLQSRTVTNANVRTNDTERPDFDVGIVAYQRLLAGAGQPKAVDQAVD